MRELRAARVPHRHYAIQELWQLLERQHVRSVARRLIGIGMRLEKQPIRARRDSCEGQGWNELARAAARARGPLPRALYAVCRVEDNRYRAGLPHAREITHVH